MQQYYDDEYEEEGLTCATAPGVVFTDMDELKEHYRSDWHRYNLKRKVAGLPVVGQELFERVMAQAGAKTGEKPRQVGTGHLKRPEELPNCSLEYWIAIGIYNRMQSFWLQGGFNRWRELYQLGSPIQPLKSTRPVVSHVSGSSGKPFEMERFLLKRFFLKWGQTLA